MFYWVTFDEASRIVKRVTVSSALGSERLFLERQCHSKALNLQNQVHRANLFQTFYPASPVVFGSLLCFAHSLSYIPPAVIIASSSVLAPQTHSICIWVYLQQRARRSDEMIVLNDDHDDGEPIRAEGICELIVESYLELLQLGARFPFFGRFFDDPSSKR